MRKAWNFAMAAGAWAVLGCLMLSGSLSASAQELTEGNASSWGTFASDSATTSVSNDPSRFKVGSQSIRFDTLSGFDTGVRYPSVANANWNLTSKNYLTFWLYSVNGSPYGFQGNQPVIVLKNSSGSSFTYTPTGNFMYLNTWHLYRVPLAGDSTWVRTSSGTPSLADIDQIEIHHDTWDFGFSIWYDGLEFVNLVPGGLPPAGPTPPPGVNANAIEQKVLLYVFDPIMENLGGQRLHTAYGWQDPVYLTTQSLNDLRVNSHDVYRPKVVETVIADKHPYFVDGFQHTDASFVTAWAAHDFHNSTFDYARFCSENNIAARIQSGELDEVWIYAPPIAGMWESTMAGDGGYWCNSSPVQGVPSTRTFVIMGLNYERGIGEAIHSFGHRSESIMDHSYGNQAPNLNNNWNKFTFQNRYQSGQGHVGNVHFPVNATSDYDYGNTTVVTSKADDWYNYPNFVGTTRNFNYTEWSPTGADTQRDYLKWWYNHLPFKGGKAPDQFLNNWWRYILDADQFKYWDGNLNFSNGLATVTMTAPVNGATVSGVVDVKANVSVDGAIGRVDLYVDGVYYASDSLAPYTFKWNTAGLTGSHTLVAKSYELQNGTEATSSTTTVTVPSYSISGTVTASGVGLSGVTMTATSTQAKRQRVTASPNSSIPDNNTTGTTSTISVAGTGTVTGVSVGVTINHTRLTDLEVSLIHPDGTVVKLHNRTGDSHDVNLMTFYPDPTTPNQVLTTLNGKAVNGSWKLRVKDLQSGTTGTFKSWSLVINYNATVTGTATTNSSGNYTVSGLPAGSWTITPTKTGRTFTPTSRSVTLGPNATGRNFTSP